jgi:hypothetical protein
LVKAVKEINRDGDFLINLPENSAYKNCYSLATFNEFKLLPGHLFQISAIDFLSKNLVPFSIQAYTDVDDRASKTNIT